MKKTKMAVLATFILLLMSGCGNSRGEECDECGGSHNISQCEAGI